MSMVHSHHTPSTSFHLPSPLLRNTLSFPKIYTTFYQQNQLNLNSTNPISVISPPTFDSAIFPHTYITHKTHHLKFKYHTITTTMTNKSLKLTTLSLLLLLLISAVSAAAPTTAPPPECSLKSVIGCYDKAKSLKLKLIAIGAILITSMIGVCLPIFSRAVPALQPDRNAFVIVKAFASGVILATGYMHVLPDSFDCLTSECLPENPWKKFPFTTFVAMLSAVMTLMVDSFALSYYKKRCSKVAIEESMKKRESNGLVVELENVGHGHGNVVVEGGDGSASQLVRYRVVAQVLELGIVVHSVVIGLSLGASNNPCTIRPLVAALCFHQLFEGMGLGGCILQAEYGAKVKAIMAFFFSATTPFGIALGIGLSNVYSDNSPTALIVVGILDAASAGLLNYMALVDLLASDFMGTKLQGSMKLQGWAYAAVILGAGGMSIMALWA
ncbi:Fe(2+) transport protein 2 [Camellia lanceoleosa]|uniref:Fe(2+) transport protein 2 n=1 Tax=Camellia lanceoleosa TaxID=1840588 RepID=A0ACC0H9B6_9ERIC|nr:Fe(2+) transport protein 2 [Camellia lanceoleosa]